MSSSPKNHTSHTQDQKPPQARYSTKSHFSSSCTPPPLPQFMLTSEVGGFTRLEGTPITYEQYVELKNEYRAMAEELKRYNELRASQQKLTAPRQCPQGQIWTSNNPIPKRQRHQHNPKN